MPVHTDTSVSDKIDSLKAEAAEKMKSPLTRGHYEGKGMMKVIDAIAEGVFAVEDAYNKARDADYWRDKHSGFGRGDSMG